MLSCSGKRVLARSIDGYTQRILHSCLSVPSIGPQGLAERSNGQFEEVNCRPLSHSLCSGSVGGLLEACCLQPMDTIKTRLQLDKVNKYKGQPNTGYTCLSLHQCSSVRMLPDGRLTSLPSWHSDTACFCGQEYSTVGKQSFTKRVSGHYGKGSHPFLLTFSSSMRCAWEPMLLIRTCCETRYAHLHQIRSQSCCRA